MKIHKLTCGHIHPLSIYLPHIQGQLAMLEALVKHQVESSPLAPWLNKISLGAQNVLAATMPYLKFPNVHLEGIHWEQEAKILNDFKITPCQCWLIETNSRLVLVDTGLGNHPQKTAAYSLQKFAMGLESEAQGVGDQILDLGHNIEDVTDIVLTHMDFDHVGDLASFPKAKVHLQLREWEMLAQCHSVMDRARFNSKLWDHEVDWNFIETAGENWLGFENVRPLSDLIQDVLLVPLYGHTLGHQGVAVPSEKALFCGDAFMHSSQIEKKAGEEALILKAYNQVAVINQPEFKVTLEQLRNFKKTNLDWEISCSHS